MPSVTRRRLIVQAALATLVADLAHAAQPLRRNWPAQRQVPALAMSTLAGAPWSPSALVGKPLLLNFWASWCEPCRDEMPALAALAEREQARGLQVVAVNYREGVDTIQRYVDAAHLALTIVRDGDGSAARALDIRAFPSTVAISRDGRIRYIVMGECDWSDAQGRRWLEELLRP